MASRPPTSSDASCRCGRVAWCPTASMSSATEPTISCEHRRVCERFGAALQAAIGAARTATAFLVERGPDPDAALLASAPYLRMLGTIVCAGLLARGHLRSPPSTCCRRALRVATATRWPSVMKSVSASFSGEESTRSTPVRLPPAAPSPPAPPTCSPSLPTTSDRCLNIRTERPTWPRAPMRTVRLASTPSARQVELFDWARHTGRRRLFVNANSSTCLDTVCASGRTVLWFASPPERPVGKLI